MWSSLGAALAAVMAAVAWQKSRAPIGGYAEAYVMTGRSHRRFALISALCCVLLLASRYADAFTLPLLAVYVLVLTLYLTSFARGFSEEES